MMRTRQLEYFIRVCDLGSISKAAATLNIAQPALGLQIKSLEDEMGAQLLVRTKSGTSPTAAGRIFLEEANHILQRIQEAKRSIRLCSADAPFTVTLGLPSSLAGSVGGSLMEQVTAKAPGIRVIIHEELSQALIKGVESGKLDMACAFGVPPSRYLLREPKLKDTLFFITHPGSDFDGAGPITLKEASRASFALTSDSDPLRRIVEDTMRNSNLPLNVLYHLDSINAIKELVVRRAACAILPFNNTYQEMKAGTLVARRIIDPPVFRPLYIIQSVRSEHHPKKAIVTSILGDVLSDLCRDNSYIEAL